MRLALAGYNPRANADAYFYDSTAAQLRVDFFKECLTHVRGELFGQPLILAPWQEATVRNMFGWKRKVDGLRRYREAFIYIPKKQGKTTFATGIGLCLLYVDDEPGAEVYAAAAARDQARLVFEPAKLMVQQDEELNSRAKIYGNSIVIEADASFFKVIPADAKTQHGLNPHGIIIDELHAQGNREFVDTLTTGTGARRQPLIVYTTTADYARDSICNEKLDYARKVRDGIIEDPEFLPVIYELGERDNWRHVRSWRKVNPNLDISVPTEYLRREFSKAEQSPNYENTFKRLYLNMVTEQETRLIPMDKWDACPAVSALAPDLKTVPCWGGLDLAQTSDITAFVLFYPELGNFIECRFWVPQNHREAGPNGMYRPWIRDGHLLTTPGDMTDYAFVRAEINELIEGRNLQDIGVDPWNAVETMIKLRDEDGVPVVSFRQGYATMNSPCKELLRLIGMGELVHNGHPVLRWMAANVAAKTDPAGNIKFDKEKSSGKIDGMVALAMALGRAMEAPPPIESVYKRRGIITL